MHCNRNQRRCSLSEFARLESGAALCLRHLAGHQSLIRKQEHLKGKSESCVDAGPGLPAHPGSEGTIKNVKHEITVLVWDEMCSTSQ